MSADCVVDASVGIKLFVIEADSDKADALFAQLKDESPPILSAPDLFYVECVNILWKYVRRFKYSTDDAHQDVSDLLQLHLRIVPTAKLLTPALELAVAFDISVYDACYCALAWELGQPLITADAALRRKLERSVVTVLPL